MQEQLKQSQMESARLMAQLKSDSETRDKEKAIAVEELRKKDIQIKKAKEDLVKVQDDLKSTQEALVNLQSTSSKEINKIKRESDDARKLSDTKAAVAISNLSSAEKAWKSTADAVTAAHVVDKGLLEDDIARLKLRIAQLLVFPWM